MNRCWIQSVSQSVCVCVCVCVMERGGRERANERASEWARERERVSERERERDRQTDRQTEAETDRQTEREYTHPIPWPNHTTVCWQPHSARLGERWEEWGVRLGGGGGGRCTKVFSTTIRQDLQHVPIFAVNHSNPLCKLYFTHQLFQATALTVEQQPAHSRNSYFTRRSNNTHMYTLKNVCHCQCIHTRPTPRDRNRSWLSNKKGKHDGVLVLARGVNGSRHLHGSVHANQLAGTRNNKNSDTDRQNWCGLRRVNVCTYTRTKNLNKKK